MRAYAARGKTVLFATHYLEEADANADRAVLMAHGRIVADGPTTEIKAQVGTRTIRATLAGRRRRARARPRCRASAGAERRGDVGDPALQRLRRGDSRAARRLPAGARHRDHRRRPRGGVPRAHQRGRRRRRTRSKAAAACDERTRSTRATSCCEPSATGASSSSRWASRWSSTSSSRARTATSANFDGTGISAPLYYMVGLASFGTMLAMISSGARIAGERQAGWTRQLRITPLSRARLLPRQGRSPPTRWRSPACCCFTSPARRSA